MTGGEVDGGDHDGGADVMAPASASGRRFNSSLANGAKPSILSA